MTFAKVCFCITVLAGSTLISKFMMLNLFVENIGGLKLKNPEKIHENPPGDTETRTPVGTYRSWWPVWSRGNVNFHPEGPGSIPGRVNFLVEVFSTLRQMTGNLGHIRLRVSFGHHNNLKPYSLIYERRRCLSLVLIQRMTRSGPGSIPGRDKFPVWGFSGFSSPVRQMSRKL